MLQVFDVVVGIKSFYASTFPGVFKSFASEVYQFLDAFVQSWDTQLFPFAIWAGINFRQLLPSGSCPAARTGAAARRAAAARGTPAVSAETQMNTDGHGWTPMPPCSSVAIGVHLWKTRPVPRARVARRQRLHYEGAMKRLGWVVALLMHRDAACAAIDIDPAKVVDLTYGFGPETIYWPTASTSRSTSVSKGEVGRLLVRGEQLSAPPSTAARTWTRRCISRAAARRPIRCR